jgi:hypothetical protein
VWSKIQKRSDRRTNSGENGGFSHRKGNLKIKANSLFSNPDHGNQLETHLIHLIPIEGQYESTDQAEFKNQAHWHH